jgi:uncharacterized protein YbjT (DUF2867 family)
VAANFAAACAAAGVRRIIYLGGLGRPGPSLSKHLASRQEAGEVLRAGPVPVTELRAAIIVGAGSASFEIIRDLARKLPVMICPRWVRSRCEPIALDQVLAYLIGCLSRARSEHLGDRRWRGAHLRSDDAPMRARLGRRICICRARVTPVLGLLAEPGHERPDAHCPSARGGLRNDVVSR